MNAVTFPESRSPEAVESWLVSKISALTGVPSEQVDINEDIVNYLTDSLEALTLAADLEAWLGIQMSTSIVWDHPTIAALAQHVAGDSAN